MPSFAQLVDNMPSAELAESSMAAELAAFPQLTRHAVDECAFQNWFPKFKRISPKATVIPLSDAFIDYLRQDGVFLPDTDDSGEDDDFDPNNPPIDESTEARQRFDFSELSNRINEVIGDYDAVFPKLNWSSPQDAAWMNAGSSLKCTSAEDVYLLLKASDFIAHDLDHSYDDCDDSEQGTHQHFSLILKKWFDMPASHEFRCFVRQRSLLAISQRDPNYYGFLQESSRQDRFIDLISNLFIDKIRDAFPQPDFTFDVYITRDESRAFLIDFNPLAMRTDSLLFSWSEILHLPTTVNHCAMRVVESETQASQSMPRYSHNRYPKDVVGLSDGTSIADFAQKWRVAVQAGVADATDPEIDSEIPGR